MPNYSTRDAEVKKLRQNQTKIANQLKIYANKMAISRATERLEADFYMERLGFLLAPATYNWRVKYHFDKNARNFINVYIVDNNKEYYFNFYLIPIGEKDNGYPLYDIVDEEKFKLEKSKFIANNSVDVDSIEYQKKIQECKNFIGEIIEKLNKCNINWKAFEAFVHDTVVANRYKDSTTTYRAETLSIDQFINYDFTNLMDKFVSLVHRNKHGVELFKYVVSLMLERMYNTYALGIIRHRLIKRLEAEGIKNIVDEIEVDSNVDLGQYLYAIHAIESGDKTYEHLIKESFKDVYDPQQLDICIKQLLKLYYEFNNVTEHNAKYLADFLIKNKIMKSKFESEVAKQPEGIEKFFGGGWGNHPDIRNFAKYLPNTSRYRFDKLVYIMRTRYGSTKNEQGKYEKLESTIKYDQQLLDKMRAVMAEFNNPDQDIAPNTTMLSIDFGPDEDSFIFKFISYKVEKETDNGTEEVEPDGRRLAEFTAMFNRSSPDIGTMYLDYTKN